MKLWFVRICHDEEGTKKRDSVVVARAIANTTVGKGTGGFIVVQFPFAAD